MQEEICRYYRLKQRIIFVKNKYREEWTSYDKYQRLSKRMSWVPDIPPILLSVGAIAKVVSSDMTSVVIDEYVPDGDKFKFQGRFRFEPEKFHTFWEEFYMPSIDRRTKK